MPAPTNVDEFLELLRKSGVQEEKKLDAYLEKLRAASSVPTEASKLAGAMVRDGLLTHFQAEQLMLGKWRRFNIGKYKVLERLGSGGMGSVFLCEHKLMRRRVAVKVLPTAKAEDPSSLERFYREARAVAALDHPNIVRAYDIDQDDNLHFLVMEYVDGASLQEIGKKFGPLDVLRACHYIRQSAQGLQHAHEAAGLVHRDIKPGNILVDRNGVVKVLDMGLARFFHDEEDILTKKYDENVLGTADYLAPEQALDSHSVDIRADIYSLGATFYFCLTGKTPFSEGTVAQKLIWHQTRQPKPIRSLRPDVPEGVVAVVERMMAKEPGQRYQTPQAVIDALEPLTQTPIGPPPAEEMPKLCPAAMGLSLSDASLTLSPPAPSGMPSPSPRKNWQVSGAASSRTSPASKPTPVAPSPPPVTKRDPRSSGSPPVAMKKPATGVMAATIPPPPVIPAPNGRAAADATRESGAPQLELVEESVRWERLAPETAEPNARADTDPKGPKKSASASGLRPTLQEYRAGERRRLLRITGLVSGAVLLVLAVTLFFVLSGGNTPDPSPPPPSNTLYVSRQGKDGAHRTIAAAFRAAKPGYHIVVRDGPIEEEPAILDSKLGMPRGITLEAEPGATVVWRLRKNIAQFNTLLSLSNVEGFCLRGFTFDGENRVRDLLLLTGDCPGLTLEDLKFVGFQRSAIDVVNCQGKNGSPVVIRKLHVEGGQNAVACLFFESSNKMPAIPVNRFIEASEIWTSGKSIPISKTAADNVNDPKTVKLP